MLNGIFAAHFERTKSGQITGIKSASIQAQPAAGWLQIIGQDENADENKENHHHHHHHLAATINSGAAQFSGGAASAAAAGASSDDEIMMTMQAKRGQDFMSMEKRLLISTLNKLFFEEVKVNLIERAHEFTDCAYTKHEHREDILMLMQCVRFQLNKLVKIIYKCVSDLTYVYLSASLGCYESI